MKQTILIGGKAGQGINKISEILTNVLGEYGYHVFNYRDYPSLIRGGHNFNLLTFSDKPVFSNDSKLDFIIAMDENTKKIHEKELKDKKGIISFEQFSELGRDSNIAQASAYLRTLGIRKEDILKEIRSQFKHEGSIKAVEQGFSSGKERIFLKKNGKTTKNLTGNNGIVQGALKSGLDNYFSYPMTPSTGVLHEIASHREIKVFQPESEVAGRNQALGSSFTGAKTMIGTSGGGFDLMTEGLSFAGMSEIPITIYLASRPGPSTGIPTYTSQADLNLALHSGHGEFPRVVVCPGNPEECEEKTNEAIFLSEKFRVPSIVLSDKHLAESGFTITENVKIRKIIQNRKIPGRGIIKASSYEHDKFGNTIEDSETVKLNAENRIKKLRGIKKFLEGLESYKNYGKNNSKKLIVSYGSTKGAILDALSSGIDARFLQIIYVSPFSEKIKKELSKYKPKDILLVENNTTAQLADLIRKETGIEIPEKNRVLRYDGRPFFGDELVKELGRRMR
jgi:2-oxoglutarate/2-oxoacid ferredoxin oxidoreductase subunit alpha